MDSNFRFRARRNQEIYGSSSDDTSSHRSKALIDRPMATERAPRVPEAARITVEELSAGIEWVELRFGFAEKPNVPTALRAHAVEGDIILYKPNHNPLDYNRPERFGYAKQHLQSASLPR
jgi:K+ transporter